MFTEQDVQPVLELKSEKVLSLYLNVDPTDPENQGSPPAWKLWFKNATKEMKGSDALKRVADYLEQYHRPAGKGLVIFAGPDDFWWEQHIPMTVNSQVHYGAPQVVQLMAIMDTYERYAVVLVSEEEARLMTAFMGWPEGGVSAQFDLDTSDWGGEVISMSADRGGPDESYKGRVEENIRRFWRDVAENVEKFVKKQDVKRIVLGGSRDAALALREMLPTRLQEMVVDVLPIPISANDAEIVERSMPAALEWEERHESKIVDRVIGAALGGGKGAVGLADVLHALQQGQVDTVVAAEPGEAEVLQCTDEACGYVEAVHDSDGCPVCGADQKTAPLAALLPDLLRAYDTGIEMVYAEEPAERINEHGGFGAVLRF